MLVPHPVPWSDGDSLGDHLRSRGVSRREFLQFCGGLAAVFGLDRLAIPRIARALETLTRPSVVWIQLQECTGCVESVLRTADPTIGNLLLDLVSLDYSHTLMAAAGGAAERALQAAMTENAGKYLLVVTDGENTSGRSPDEVVREISRKSEGAVQVYFVAFDTSPEKFAFLKEVGGDVIGAGTGAELRQALDGIYQGKILAEAPGAAEREPAKQ